MANELLPGRVTQLHPELEPWTAKGLKLVLAEPNRFGLFYVSYVGKGRSDREVSVEVKDEQGRLLSHIYVLGGFHTGPSWPVPPSNPAGQFGELRGFLEQTSAGFIKFTVGEGGIDVFVIDYDPIQGEATAINRPSDGVINIPVLANPPGRYDHTSVHIEFTRFTPQGNESPAGNRRR